MDKAFQGMISFRPQKSYVVGCHHFTIDGTEVHKLGQVHMAKKWKNSDFNFTAPEILNPRAYFLNHYTALINIEGNKRAQRASKDTWVLALFQ